MGIIEPSKYSKYEQDVLKSYLERTSDLGLTQIDIVEMLDQVILESKNQGTYNLPYCFGDMVVDYSYIPKDVSMRKFIENIRSHSVDWVLEDVTDENVKWWWNWYDILKRMRLKTDELRRLTVFINTIKHFANLPKDEAGKKATAQVFKLHPKYGSYDEISKSVESDRPLPFELMDRIDNYIQRRLELDREKFESDLITSSSFNALVRKEILAGNI